MCGGDDGDDDDGAGEGEVGAEEAERVATAAEAARALGGGGGGAQLAPSLITYSSLPPSHTRTLLNLDVISARNKPVEPPKQPESAPFFLPTAEGVERSFVPPPATEPDAEPEAEGDAEGGAAEGASARATKRARAPLADAAPSELAALLIAAEEALTRGVVGADADADADEDVHVAAIGAHLVSLSPSALDYALRTLGPALGSSSADAPSRLLRLALLYLETQLDARRNFELVQARDPLPCQPPRATAAA